MAKETTKSKVTASVIASVLSAIILAVIIGLFAFVSDTKTDKKINEIKINENQKKIDKNSDNIEYLQKTVNLTNNNVMEIDYKIQQLPTLKDFEKLKDEIRHILSRHNDRNETVEK